VPVLISNADIYSVNKYRLLEFKIKINLRLRLLLRLRLRLVLELQVCAFAPF